METLFLNAAKAAQALADGGVPYDEICSRLVSLKGSEFTIRFDGCTYFDPRELRRIADTFRAKNLSLESRPASS